MKIGLDFDGVQGNSHYLKPLIAKNMFGIEIPADRFERHLVVPDVLTKEQYEAVGREAFFGDYIIPPIKDALFYMEILLGHGHQLSTITSRSGEALKIAERLQREYGVIMPIVGVGYGVSKLDACRGLDVYVDDDLRKLIPMMGVVPHLVLFSSPTNTEDELPEGIVRVADWYSLYNHIYHEIRI